MKALIVLSILITITSAITFNCTFILKQDRSAYLCYATILSYTDKVVTDVVGTHLEGKSNANVTLVAINDKNLTFIPQGIEIFFPSIDSIDLRDCGIEALLGTELDNYVNLARIELFANDIQSIPGGLFKNNRKLTRIGFSSNLIKHIEAGLLDGLEDLKYVWFNYNVCISMEAKTPSAIAELKEVLVKNCTAYEEATTESAEKLKLCSTRSLDENVCRLTAQMEMIGELKKMITEQNEMIKRISDDVSELKRKLN